MSTSLQSFKRTVDPQTVTKAGRWSIGGTFTSLHLRDLCPQADRIRKTGPEGGHRRDSGYISHPPSLNTFTFIAVGLVDPIGSHSLF